MFIRKILAIMTLALILPVASWASTGFQGFNYTINFFYDSFERDNAGTTTESTEMIPEMQFGYTMPMGVYFGGVYYTYDQSTGAAFDPSMTAIGASVGYANSGFNFVLHYFLSAEFDVSATNTREGDGIGFDLGMNFMLGSLFSIGPNLSYRQFSFDEDSNGSIDITDTDIQPTIQFGFTF